MSNDAVIPFGIPVPADVLEPEQAHEFIAQIRVKPIGGVRDEQINICWPEFGEAHTALAELKRFVQYNGFGANFGRPPIFELISRHGRRKFRLWPVSFQQIDDLDIFSCNLFSGPNGPLMVELRFQQTWPGIAFRFVPQVAKTAHPAP